MQSILNHEPHAPDLAGERSKARADLDVAVREVARMPSRIVIISPSKMAQKGALIARMTRGDTGLGPGPSRSRSADGSMKPFEERSDLLDGVAGERA